jgi:hypothetical protein
MFSYFIISSKIKFPCTLESSIIYIPFFLVLVFRIIYLWFLVATTCLVGVRASKISRLVILSSYKR